MTPPRPKSVCGDTKTALTTEFYYFLWNFTCHFVNKAYAKKRAKAELSSRREEKSTWQEAWHATHCGFGFVGKNQFPRKEEQSYKKKRIFFSRGSRSTHKAREAFLISTASNLTGAKPISSHYYQFFSPARRFCDIPQVLIRR